MKASEEKYWMENYPKEAETIITLSKLFDELGNDDASKAQLDYVIGLLRRKEEGRLIELPTMQSGWICDYCRYADKNGNKNPCKDCILAYGGMSDIKFTGKKVMEVTDEN